MSNNRTEQQALVDGLAPTVDLAELQAALVQDGYVFRKDVTQIGASTSGTINVNYSARDQYRYTLSGDATINLLGLEDGDIQKLSIAKGSTNIITWGTGIDSYHGSISYGLTEMDFLIISTGGHVTVYHINDENRTFNLSGTPGSGVSLFSQNNIIRGRYAHININVDFTGAEDTILDLGTFPFASEVSFSADQYLSIQSVSTNIIETAVAWYSNSGSRLRGKFGKTGVQYYISGTIVF